MDLTYDPLSNSFSGNSHYVNSLVQVMWHITNACNLNCKFCFSKFLRNDSSVLSTEVIDKNISLFKKLGVLKLDISGGEPLLVDSLPYIVDECHKAGIAVTLTTSGSGAVQNIEWLKTNWHSFSRIILSLDGPKDIHNELRGSHFAYQNFIALYQVLKDNGCDIIRVNTVVSKQLLKSKDLLFGLLLDLEPKEWCCIEPHPANKVDTFDEVAVSTSDFHEFITASTDRIRKSPIKFLMRTKKDYSSYWTLYPNQLLCHLSELDTSDFSIDFSEKNISVKSRNIKQFPQFCIKRKDE